MQVLAVDPGEKRLGIAISDPSGTIANPLTVLKHVSRPVDAASIAQIAEENQVGQIVVGQALDTENQPTLQSRRAAHLAEAIRQQTSLPVVLWDETGSTQAARAARTRPWASSTTWRTTADYLATWTTLSCHLRSYRPYLKSDAPMPR